ncbi:hypothetical protein PtA15_8A109 [Puccinia triticina]|uniref:Uncharacterized protein n=1 Tax=Puccinia triticina TaxID=208348 RepID=A0ABY7CS85_9BASI|nr:uncharacterized protein PtA15_8A109 [Puccinia triticina]WAQ87208.1 hypothetical protein PtA15_8A109 [Puccinia triticina]
MSALHTLTNCATRDLQAAMKINGTIGPSLCIDNLDKEELSAAVCEERYLLRDFLIVLGS